MTFLSLKSPNYGSRGSSSVSLLVLHYTGMKSAQAALARLCDESTQVSAHYVVDEDGTAYALVDEKDCAWHAGISFWRGKRNVNDISIGIEIVNPGHEWGYRPFPAQQMEAVAALSRSIIQRHAIAPRNVVAHSDIAPQRKCDPGELFDWQWLAQQGVGLWPMHVPSEVGHRLVPGDSGDAVAQMQAMLAEYGYEVPENGQFDDATQRVVIAFQRHFRPRDIAGCWDGECGAMLQGLLKMLELRSMRVTQDL